MGKNVELRVDLLERVLMKYLAEHIQVKRVLKSILEYIDELDDTQKISHLYNKNYINEKTILNDLLIFQVEELEKVGAPADILDSKCFEASHVLNLLSAAASDKSNPFSILKESLNQSNLSDTLNISTNFVEDNSDPFYQTGGLDSDAWKLLLMEI